MEIREQQVTVTGNGTADIPCSVWSTSDAPRGVVLLGHGLGTTSRWGDFASVLSIAKSAEVRRERQLTKA